MSTDKKINIVCNLLYIYGGLHLLLSLLNLVPPLEEETMRTLIQGVIHGGIFIAIAYYLPRKPSKSMYWVSVALIGLQLLRQIGGAGLLIWLQSSEISAALDTSFYILAALSFILLAVSVFFLLQRDVRQKLINANNPASNL